MARTKKRLWTPKDLKETPKCWLDCNDCEVERDWNGDITGVYSKEHCLFRPLLGYYALRYGETVENGMRWLGSVAGDVVASRYSFCSQTSASWFNGKTGITVVGAIKRFSSSIGSGIWAFSSRSDEGTDCATQDQQMLLLRWNQAKTVQYNFRRVPNDTRAITTGVQTNLPTACNFVCSQRFSVSGTPCGSVHVGNATQWSGMVEQSGVSSGAFNGLPNTQYQMMLGAERANLVSSAKEALGEVIVFESVLSDEDVEKVEGYLAHKWGATASLPDSHGYKDEPPYVVDERPFWEIKSSYVFAQSLKVSMTVMNGDSSVTISADKIDLSSLPKPKDAYDNTDVRGVYSVMSPNGTITLGKGQKTAVLNVKFEPFDSERYKKQYVNVMLQC